jgi:DNA-binding MltR family transcriptional regulator
LVAAQVLDSGLEMLLRKNMSDDGNVRRGCVRQLFEDMGPLGTFSAKISLCTAFKLVDEDLSADLTTIRKIRNKFAHSSGLITFEEQAISALTCNLKSGIIGNVMPVEMKKDWRPDTNKLRFAFERTRFMLGSAGCLGTLHRLAAPT